MKSLITDISHKLISDLFDKNDIVVDATMGNGNDTLFLAEKALHVYAFDIQENALIRTKSITRHLSNITYILDSHENIFSYIEYAKGYVFNLGYLPNGNKDISTTSISTIKTLTSIFDKLRKNDFVLVVCYPGHDEGKIESIALKSLLDTIDKSSLDIVRTTLEYKKNIPPYILLITKTK